MELDVVTVSRQLGSEGDRIAENVAKALGYEYVDRRLVEEIASITDTSVEEVEKYDEKGEGRVRYFLKRLLVPEMSPGASRSRRRPISPSSASNSHTFSKGREGNRPPTSIAVLTSFS